MYEVAESESIHNPGVSELVFAKVCRIPRQLWEGLCAHPDSAQAVLSVVPSATSPAPSHPPPPRDPVHSSQAHSSLPAGWFWGLPLRSCTVPPPLPFGDTNLSTDSQSS